MGKKAACPEHERFGLLRSVKDFIAFFVFLRTQAVEIHTLVQPEHLLGIQRLAAADQILTPFPAAKNKPPVVLNASS